MEMRPLHAHYPPAHSHLGAVGLGEDVPGREGMVPGNPFASIPELPDQ